MIGPLAVSGAEGLFGFTVKLEPLQRWANNPLDRWDGQATGRMLEPLDRWDGDRESDVVERRLDPLERWSAQ
ncbi:hypothetical protein V7968_26055 [Nocardia vulneris]|uniref:hypothetical protein n=1 Tax=Nocardia vulneris TaxID=1141657 RepID=UPI0030CF0AF3